MLHSVQKHRINQLKKEPQKKQLCTRPCHKMFLNHPVDGERRMPISVLLSTGGVRQMGRKRDPYEVRIGL